MSPDPAKGYTGTQEIRIDLSGNAPVVYVDGKVTGTTFEITYCSPPSPPLLVEKVWFRVRPAPITGEFESLWCDAREFFETRLPADLLSLTAFAVDRGRMAMRSADDHERYEPDAEKVLREWTERRRPSVRARA